MSSRKSIITNFTINGFVGLPGEANNELNLIVESFTSENATISSLPAVVDADNPDPSPIRKVTESTSNPSMLHSGCRLHQIKVKIYQYMKLMWRKEWMSLVKSWIGTS